MTKEPDSKNAFEQYMKSQVGKKIDIPNHEAMLRSFGVKTKSETIWSSKVTPATSENSENDTPTRSDNDAPPFEISIETATFLVLLPSFLSEVN